MPRRHSWTDLPHCPPLRVAEQHADEHREEEHLARPGMVKARNCGCPQLVGGGPHQRQLFSLHYARVEVGCNGRHDGRGVQSGVSGTAFDARPLSQGRVRGAMWWDGRWSARGLTINDLYSLALIIGILGGFAVVVAVLLAIAIGARIVLVGIAASPALLLGFAGAAVAAVVVARGMIVVLVF